MTPPPTLEQFRIETRDTGLVHLVFDCPGRTMNVFSEAAIAELGAFAAWLPDADVRGVLIRSGKPNAFCAGADLTELGVAYDTIMAAPKRTRFGVAFDHFFRLSSAIRALETAGKPVAAAIGGLALGGGCELALGAHHRVLVDDPKVSMGLPESLVGLLPGAGGTQRLPRLIGFADAIPILLDGRRLAGAAALDAGLVHELSAAGDEIERAEAWLMSSPEPTQPWDREDWEPVGATTVSNELLSVRTRILEETKGHYPAPLAILDCLEFGLPQLFDGAIRSEMSIFAELIQREEARNMIQTLFLARTDYDRLARKNALPAFVASGVSAARAAIEGRDASALGLAGFAGHSSAPLRVRTTQGYWVDGITPEATRARAELVAISAAVASVGAGLSAEQRRLVDYAIVQATGYPAYLGGPFAYAARKP